MGTVIQAVLVTVVDKNIMRRVGSVFVAIQEIVTLIGIPVAIGTAYGTAFITFKRKYPTGRLWFIPGFFKLFY